MSDWQTIVAIALCLAAAGYIGWRAWRTLAGRKSAGCGTGCGTRPSADSTTKSGSILQIERAPGEREA